MPVETIKEMIGKQFVVVQNKNNEELIFLSKDGSGVRFYHERDCWVSVYIEDVCGDLDDLRDSPIIIAEVVENADGDNIDGDASFTWTFYKFATIKGSVVVRWYGSSNGFYSETVDMKIIKSKKSS